MTIILFNNCIAQDYVMVLQLKHLKDSHAITPMTAYNENIILETDGGHNSPQTTQCEPMQLLRGLRIRVHNRFTNDCVFNITLL